MEAALSLSEFEDVAILDSCGSGNLGSHLLIVGINPAESAVLENQQIDTTLTEFDRFCMSGLASVYTLSYDFGLRLIGLESRHKTACEPDISIQAFENLIVHDYSNNTTTITGNPSSKNLIKSKLLKSRPGRADSLTQIPQFEAVSNFTKHAYVQRVDSIREEIRQGNTYQTNLTQRFTASLDKKNSAQSVFRKLRKDHGAAFSAFIRHGEKYVVSISPERFFRVSPIEYSRRRIESSPIKGTVRRGKTADEDSELKASLEKSSKDLAENTMIVDLIRNDLGRISEFGSVQVESLCEIEEHPTLFHLVSTVSGQLRHEINPSDILRAMFPCGSITGCPKISTMRLIDELETVPRGLSMGAIGYSGFDGTIDLNVAIRTIVIKNNLATFNVGGGVVIDSDPESEYRESLLKAQALFRALGIKFVEK